MEAAEKSSQRAEEEEEKVIISLNELQECGAEKIGAHLRNGYLLCLCAYTEV